MSKRWYRWIAKVDYKGDVIMRPGDPNKKEEPSRLLSVAQIWASQWMLRLDQRWLGVVLKDNDKYVACTNRHNHPRLVYFDDFDAAVMAVRMMR